MSPSLANTYISLKREFNELVHKKLSDRNFDVGSHGELLEAVRLLVSEDQYEGKFVVNHPPRSLQRSYRKLSFQRRAVVLRIQNLISKHCSLGLATNHPVTRQHN